MANKKDTLYYDDECPICSKEMQRLARLKDDSLELVSIKDADVDDELREQMHQELHIKTSQGHFIRGYAANLYAWQKTRYKVIAFVCALPPFSWFVRIGYAIWLLYYRWQRNRRTYKK